MDKKGIDICVKWAWEKKEEGKGCRLEIPWLFQGFGNVGRIIKGFITHDRPHSYATSNNKIKKLQRSAPDDAEERALALALTTKKEATLIQFYSPKCRLCASLAKVVMEVEARNAEWLNIVMVDVENRAWLPEVLHYDIKYVPCFVLLDTYGTALAKTGTPASRSHVLTGLSYLLESMQPIRKEILHVPSRGNGSAA